ncbi:S41 family peptidase [Psychrobium sp. 1_MG-2023]|uniref:S41 family peptidase n=1 Tax=Psychrobium sp. 1_MG-2023 TaxID=3062624 RepID=UPI000C32F9AE|nr:S41 family peptidase [Psychrobium sp. 1_MG-2023]MDP2561507.1 S41 family peptidase [Psychrobium sp. 1_MG-2023]PKF57772.1 peptidase S41 [Alteromonadales bacterium alter-6D02]
MKLKLAFSLFLGLCGSATAATGYYRSPDIHKDTLVFTAEGDLWVSQLNQRQARRLTTHPAEETQAAISNDGSQVAFVANYEGTKEVYVIGINGGIAKRISFENSAVKLQGWTADDKVLYSSNNRVGPKGNWTLRQVDPENLVASTIPLADAIEGAIDQDNKNIYFVQFGLQVSTDNAKVYRGGAKGELWSYRLGSSKEAKKLTTDHIGSVRQPMVYQDTLYFISDASGNDNIWSMNLDGSQQRQVTRYKDWPVRSAKLDQGKIIYQLGADLKLLDLNAANSDTLAIELTSDLPNLREHWLNQPLKYATSTRQASDDDKVVITARGRVAVASIDNSRLVEIATQPESRTRKAILSHDGKWVYAINDTSGEMELWKYAADGSDNAKQLTDNGSIFRWDISLSPDGQWLAHDDMNGDLWLLNINTGKNKKIMSMGAGLDPYSRVVWSADSKLLATTRSHQKDERSRVELFSIDSSKSLTLTSDKYNSFSPAFSPDGNWIYFLSDRSFTASPTSPWGDRNLGTTFDRRTQVFAYSLKKDASFPFQTANELMVKHNDKSDKKEDKKAKKNSSVDWKGLTDRLWQVPVPSGNYASLSVNDKFLYLTDRVNEPKTKPTLQSIKIKPSPKLTQFANNVADYSLSDDGKRMFVKLRGGNNSKLYIVDAGGKMPSDLTDAKVVTKDWQLLINPRHEWNQIFHDAWIMHRDSFFDKDMRGLDWQATKEKYQPLLDRITDRHELNDIFAQMMGELNALHSQVRGGDVPKDANSARTATLGAVLTQGRRGVLIEHIYQFDKELPSQASPLLRPGVDARNGDIITAINGITIKSVADLNHQLRNQAGKQVLLSLKRGRKAVQTIVTPTSPRTDRTLRYNDWVNNNRIKVEKAHKEIGYLHLEAMIAKDIASFAREFYANYNKHGLIIDVRRNNGGNIDSWIIEKLLRRAWMFWQAPIGEASTNMQQTFRGHLVVLADQYTYSDGETFTAGIKALDIAPVIGKKTAGAGVWLRGMNRLSDNGMARVAEFPQYAMDGRWVVEGSGVEPTIEVDNLPHATFNGKDAQLETAIKYLKGQMKKSPIKPLKAKPFPKNPQPADDILPK